MITQYHILNGDALKEQFPRQMPGEIIVARECLVDGPVEGDSLEKLFETRSRFISENYEGFTKEDYYPKTASEFEKISNLPHGAEINLWFEDDLFCQVNFWFVCSLLRDPSKKYSIYLVRPEIHTRFGFGGLNEAELLGIFENKRKLTQIEKLAALWELYQLEKTDEMLEIGKELENDLPFLLPAIQAHIDRIPSNGNHGRPTESLIEIREELKTDDFGTIFREFNKRESIYGFGDLQVKRLLDELS